MAKVVSIASRIRTERVDQENNSMTRVITRGDRYDFVKTSLLSHYVASGYVVALA